MQEIKEFFNKSTIIEKRLILCYSVIAIMLSVICFYYFMSNKIYFIGSDAYSYMSMADSLRDSGELLDITTIPPTPAKTPQNGIVLVHLILSYLGLSQYQRLISIVVINYVIYLSAVYPLIKMASGCGLKENKFAIMSLIGAHLGAWHIYRFELLAINDGIFYSSTIWLSYLIFHLIKRYYDGNSQKRLAVNRHLLLTVLIVAFFSLLFRINTIFIMFAMILTVLIFDTINKNFRMTIFLFGVSFSVIGMFFLVYQFIDITTIKFITKNTINGLPSLFDLTHWFTQTKRFVLDTLPRIAARPIFYGRPNIIYAVFLVPPFISFVRAYKEKKAGVMFISLQCIVIFIIGTLILNRARYIMHIYPLLYLMMFSIPKTRLVGHLFVLLVITNTVRTVSREWVRVRDSNLWIHIYENRISLPQDEPLLLTWKARHSYFFLNTRSYRAANDDDGTLDGHITFPKGLNWDLIHERGSLFVLGDSTYINSSYNQVQEMASSDGYVLKLNPITPKFDEFKGWALVEFQITEDDPL